MGSDELRVVLCTCPPDAAAHIARRLLEERLVACVNVVSGVRSLYWWKGEVTEGGESLLVIKTPPACYERMEALLVEIHPYDVPEILALAVERGSEAYLSWVAESTAC